MPRRILILPYIDRFANGVWATETKRVLEAKGYEVTFLQELYRKKNGLSPSWGIEQLSEYADSIRLSKRMHSSIRGRAYYARLRRRARNLEVKIVKEKPDAVICLNEMESYVLTKELGCLKIFSCPSPFIDELY